MSSTSRGAQRQEHDYYVTPPALVQVFLREWFKDEPDVRGSILRCGALDPCAGGNRQPVVWEYKPATEKKPAVVIHLPPTGMTYPEVLAHNGIYARTNDVRPDSPAEWHHDFLAENLPLVESPALVITNPPFFSAMAIIQRSLQVVRPGGWVAMLLRINFLGSEKRFPFFRNNPPYRAYVHHERPSFLPTGETDSVGYMHAVWHSGKPATAITLRVI